MKFLVGLLFVSALVAVVVSRPAEEEDKYTTKYDNFDVDKVLENKRLLGNYVSCLLDKGKCTKEGQELKNRIGDALESECAKCSDKQREVGRKVLKHLFEKEQEYFKELEAKYDPTGAYRKRYAETANKEGINL